MKYKYLLPLGSVVEIKNKNTPLMIISNNGEDYEYIGVSYPIGFSNEKQNTKFKVKDIKKVFFIGYDNKNMNKELRSKNIDRIIKKGGKMDE